MHDTNPIDVTRLDSEPKRSQESERFNVSFLIESDGTDSEPIEVQVENGSTTMEMSQGMGEVRLTHLQARSLRTIINCILRGTA